ncbi:MAG: aminotransferase class I/II-fold pyridoxal phosphate-dependent enzyme, partial [Planctomycetota bacterium]
MSSSVADRLAPFGTTIFAEMTRLAAEHRAINLSQGFPDFDGPEFVRHAAQRAIDAGHNQYARPGGEPVLVEALADDFSARTGVSCDPMREVTVTGGCTGAIAASMLGLINPGDEVVLFEPYYDCYRACVALAGGTPRFVAMRPRDGRFTFDEHELRAAFGPRTRAVLLNTPHNPTGTVLDRGELSAVAALAREHDAFVVADEVYEHLVFEGEHVSIASLPGMAERTLTLSSLGKTFSLTGWKIGWAIGPEHLTAGVRSAQQFLAFSVSTPMQHAAAEAIRR